MSSPPPEHIYLHGHHDAVLRSHRWRTADNSAAYLLERLRPGAAVLDVGCGPGTITLDLASRLPEGWVVGIDAEPGVVQQARAASAALRLGNLRFEVGDVRRLEFEDAGFDVVHAHQVLQHLADPVAALVEMRRVCRPDGLVACRDADYGAMCWYPVSDTMTRWQSLYREAARRAGGEPDAGRHLNAWARAAGFSRVETSASVWSFATPEERRWWGELWAERVTESRFAEQSVAAGLATQDELQRIAEGWQMWSNSADACFFVVHGEILCTP
jgi:ubiquinone/menaquinone biosynthesis C-methylase UbiE